jgi:hypothetical protein
MKKLIVAGILVVSFSLSATAQSKKVNTTPVKSEMTLMTPEFAAQKNVTDLTAFVSVNPEMKAILLELFSTKYRMFSSDSSEQNKSFVSQVISKKLEATLDAATYKKVRENETLFQSLIN